MARRTTRSRLSVEGLEVRAMPAGIFGTAKPFASPNLGPNTALIAVGRFNSDSVLDAAVTNYGGTNSVTTLLGNGNGLFRQATRVTVAAGGVNRQPEGVTAFDFDRDGDSDLAVVLNGGSQNNLVILRNVGRFSGQFQVAQRLTVGTNATHLAAIDLDNDGDQDLAAALFGGGVRIVKNNGGVFAAGARVASGGGGSNQIAVSDLDHDGDRDLAVANQADGTVGVLENTGGTFALVDTLAAGSGTTFVAAGDIDGDGFDDLAASNTFGSSVGVFLNKGGTGFDPVKLVEVGANPTGIVARDLNGDRLTDIAVGIGSRGDVVVLRNNGEGGFLDAVQYAVTPGITGLTAADLNNDGRPDLLATQYDAGGGVATVLNKLVSTTTVVTGPASAPAGQSVTFRATVAAANGAVPATGYVNFFDGPTYLTTVAVANGVAEFTPGSLPATATHTIRAVYSDAVDLNFNGSADAGLPFVIE